MLPKITSYEYPYVYVQVCVIDIQTGQGRVTLGSIDIMIGYQLDEMQVFQGDHQQITNMMCFIYSCMYFFQMQFVGNKITNLPTWTNLDLSSVGLCGTCQIPVSQKVFQDINS